MLPNVLGKLQKLRNYRGEISSFWEQYLDILRSICPVEAGMILIYNAEQQDWHSLAMHPVQSPHLKKYLETFLTHVNQVWQEASQSGWALIQTPQAFLMGAALILDAKQTRCLYLGYVDKNNQETALQTGTNLLFVRDLYAQYRIRQSVQENLLTKNDTIKILDILTQMNNQDRFIAACFTLVNELATREKCDQVSLGWFENGYIKIKAISHVENFNEKMEIIGDLVQTMEESLEQDAEILYPTDPTSVRYIFRAHEHYAKKNDTRVLLSLPLRSGDNIIAVCTLEKTSLFSESEMKSLRVIMDQCTPRLETLSLQDRWFGSRWRYAIRKQLAKVLGIEYTFWKTAALLSLMIMILAITIPIPYRIDAPVMLRTKDVHYITAPFDGYIDSVSVEPGDTLRKNEELLRLDQSELLLQEAELMAQIQSTQREKQKAQASAELARVRIYTAQLKQVQAQLETIRFQLRQSIIRSPIAQAIVVDGDQSKRSGAPVHQGDHLFRIAGLQRIYAEIDLPETEIQYLDSSTTGEIALKSRPDKKLTFQMTHWIPSANIKEQTNVFLLRARLQDSIPPWIRPGMTGIAKVNAGKRSLWWILSHSTLDFLRLKLWW